VSHTHVNTLCKNYAGLYCIAARNTTQRKQCVNSNELDQEFAFMKHSFGVCLPLRFSQGDCQTQCIHPINIVSKIKKCLFGGVSP
jgi:hypothetical protein